MLRTVSTRSLVTTQNTGQRLGIVFISALATAPLGCTLLTSLTSYPGGARLTRLGGGLGELRVVVIDGDMKGTQLVSQASDGVGSVGISSVQITTGPLTANHTWKTERGTWRVSCD